MSSYMIEIDDKAVTEQINRVIDTIFNDQIRRKYSETGDVIAIAVKELVYSHKDEIIEKVVDRAATEIPVLSESLYSFVPIKREKKDEVHSS